MGCFLPLEHKYCSSDSCVTGAAVGEIEGYASLFGKADRCGDTVERGAYAKSLAAVATSGRQIKMLWQHDPTQPIGIWDEIREDAKGLYLKGRLLEGVGKAQEARVLVAAGAVDGLSIGYRTVRAQKSPTGGRTLSELDLWEISLVTFPMLQCARVSSKSDMPVDPDIVRQLAEALRSASRLLTS